MHAHTNVYMHVVAPRAGDTAQIHAEAARTAPRTHTHRHLLTHTHTYGRVHSNFHCSRSGGATTRPTRSLGSQTPYVPVDFPARLIPNKKRI